MAVQMYLCTLFNWLTVEYLTTETENWTNQNFYFRQILEMLQWKGGTRKRRHLFFQPHKPHHQRYRSCLTDTVVKKSHQVSTLTNNKIWIFLSMYKLNVGNAYYSFKNPLVQGGYTITWIADSRVSYFYLLSAI